MWPSPRLVRLVIVAIFFCLAGQATYSQGPHIRSIAPATGRAGETVTITGGGFGALNVQVTVGGIAAAVLNASGNHVTFVVPSGVPAGMAAVTATNPGGRAATIGFQVFGSGLLAGDPGTRAIDAVFDLPPVAAPDADIEGSLIMSRLDVRLAPDATVGHVNAAVSSVGGTIASMTRGFSVLTIAVPRQPSVEALLSLVASLRAAPGIAYASLARTAAEAALPTAVTTVLDAQLLPTRFPAAWNARHLVVDSAGECRQSRVAVLVADAFTHPAPLVSDVGTNFVTFDHEVPDFKLSPEETASTTHGNLVTLLLGAMFNADARTGANPFTRCLDITGVQVRGLSEVQAIDRIADSLPAGKFILNYSMSWPKFCTEAGEPVDCEPADFGTEIPDAIDRAEDTLWWKARSHERSNDFLLAAAAGNTRDKQIAELYPTLGTASMSSYINAATLPDPFFGFAQEATRWQPTNSEFPNLVATPEQMRHLAGAVTVLGLETVGGAPNVLKVGSTSAGDDYPDLVASDFSNLGHDVSAVGEGILGVDGATTQGTSFSSPQVAGLASYLWLLSPGLRALPAAMTRQAIAANAITAAQASAVIDAYAAVLSLDQTIHPTPVSAPIRHAILDTNNDGRFDEQDLAAYRFAYLDAAGGPADPAERDYGRHDLNGDGFTGGPTKTSRFDLDRVGSNQFGVTSYAIVDTQIEGVDVSFNETRLTDLQILCYYAYSDLYQGTSAGRAQVLHGLCVERTIVVDPAAVTVSAGATQQFSADVTGLADPRVTWTATAGTISDTGLFTAGATPGTVTVRAISIVDPNTFADAVVTVTGGERSNAFLGIGVTSVPAGQIRAAVFATGFDVTRPVSEASSVIAAFRQELTKVSVGILTLQIHHPMAFSFDAGDVRRLAMSADLGATLDITAGTLRRDSADPGNQGDGSVLISVRDANVRVRALRAELLQIQAVRSTINVSIPTLDGITIGNTFNRSESNNISVTVDQFTEGLHRGFASVSGNNDSTVRLSGASPRGFFYILNHNVSVSAGDIAGNLRIERNSVPQGLAALGFGNVSGDLTITGNQGFTDADARAWAALRQVGGSITVLDNR